MTFKKKFQKLSDVFNRINDKNLPNLIKLSGASDQWLSYENKKLFKNMWHFIYHAPEELIELVISFDKYFEIESKLYRYNYNNKQNWVKYIYLKDEKPVFKEVDLNTYEGLKVAINIVETSDKMLGVLPLIDKFDIGRGGEKRETIRLYDGDFVSVGEFLNTHIRKIVLAKYDNDYRNGYFVELIYSFEYGYLTQNGHVNSKNKSIKIITDKDINSKDQQCNSHVITLGDDYKYLGNILTDLHLLEPLKTE